MVHAHILQKYSLFGGLMVEQIERILPFMKEETYNAGEVIIPEGRPNDRIFFISEGKVSVSKNGYLLSNFCEGDAFGEMEVLDVMPAVASITATTQVKALTISNKGLRDVYKTDIKVFALLIMNLARDLSRRMRKMDDKVAPESKPIFI